MELIINVFTARIVNFLKNSSTALSFGVLLIWRVGDRLMQAFGLPGTILKALVFVLLAFYNSSLNWLGIETVRLDLL